MRTIFIITLVLLGRITYAQYSEGGIPLLDYTLKNNKQILPKVYGIKSYKNDSLEAESIKQYSDCNSCKKNFYGIEELRYLDIKKSGQYINIGDTTDVWVLTIKSTNALAIQVIFKNFIVPLKAKMYIYSENREMILGAITNNQSILNPHFTTQPIIGNSIIIEYSEPKRTNLKGQIEIDGFVYSFKNILKTGPYGVSGSCHNNVICEPHMWKWRREINSVGLILYKSNNNLYAHCSGSLINNTANNGIPYFLTANHCINSTNAIANNPQNWVVLFHHQAQSCSGNGSDAPTIYSISGGQKLTNNSNSDFTLINLSTTSEILKNYKVCLAGWNNTETITSESGSIHHPAGDAKKISLSNTLPTSSGWYTNGTSHWKVYWSSGVTEGGSSGSPLFDNNKRIIGQLHGGPSSCSASASDKYDYYGKFSVSYADGNLSQFLDPTNSGVNSVDTYCYENCETDNLMVSNSQLNGSVNKIGGLTVEASNTAVNSGAYVNFVAKNQIRLKPGFRANNGSYFRAKNYSFECSMSIITGLRVASQIANLEQPSLNSETSVRLYPNPNNGSFTLSIKSLSKLKSVEIINMLGNIIFTESVISEQTIDKIYSLSNIKEGYYILKVEFEDVIKTIKFELIK